MNKILFTLVILLLVIVNNYAQTKPDTSKLPEYIVIESNNSPSLLGGIGLVLNTKNSEYESELNNLIDYLESKKNGAGVRTLTDFLTAMYNIGYEYVNAFNANSLSTSTKDGTLSGEKIRNEFVFKKRK